MPPAAATKTPAGSSSLKIKGSLDTGDIDRGFSRVGQGFTRVKGFAKGLTSDMGRITNAVSGLVRKLGILGVLGPSALIALASKAPAVAPAMAKISVAFGKLSRNLGEALAPAFERVAGWLDKLAAWVGNNKEKITEISNKFLDWAEAIGKKLWPFLEKIGQWAMDHPGLFAGIVAGLALGPSILAGISAISGLVTTIAGSTVGAGILSALGYLAAIGGVAYLGYKGASALIDKLQGYAGMGTNPSAPTDMSGQTLVNRLPQKIWADLTGGVAPWEDPDNPNSPARQALLEDIKRNAPSRIEMYKEHPEMRPTMSAAEDRRMFFLQWWDAVWG